MNKLKLIFTICFGILSFAVPNASFAWSDKIIVTEHDLITNKVELASGLTFTISKDFLVQDDLITNLMGQYQEGNAKYFFANISLGSLTFASVKFDTLDYKIKQENLVDLADEQLEAYFGNEKNSEQLLCDNQMVILPWLSTTFFQSLPFRNKIFIYDNECFDEYFKRPKNDIFFSNSIKKFTTSLEKFLPKLNNTQFYHNKKAMKYFLNGNKLSNIKESFDKSVSFILRNNI